MTTMSKLKIESVLDEKPVKVTVELPAGVERDLRVYAELMKRASGQSLNDPARLIAPMLKQFMATDRAFRKFRRQLAQERGG
jgi:hypothetical protein